jgi:hypothetical protein
VRHAIIGKRKRAVTEEAIHLTIGEKAAQHGLLILSFRALTPVYCECAIPIEAVKTCLPVFFLAETCIDPEFIVGIEDAIKCAGDREAVFDVISGDSGGLELRDFETWLRL